MKTAQYLIGLREKQKEDWRKPSGPIKFGEDRPKTISYEDGTQIILEKDKPHPEIKFPDRVSIKTSKGTFVLNEMSGLHDLRSKSRKPVYFCDSGDDFELRSHYNHPDQWEFTVIYGSESLEKSKRSVYSLLHELCHVRLHGDYSHETKAGTESAIWEEADRLVEQMGLNLFENETERQLFSDVHLRSYDLYNEDGIIKDGLMAQIDGKKLDAKRLGFNPKSEFEEATILFNLMYGLMQAAHLGLPLEDLCRKLIEENN